MFDSPGTAKGHQRKVRTIKEQAGLRAAGRGEERKEGAGARRRGGAECGA